MSSIQSGVGFADLFPPQSDTFTSIEAQARSVFSRYCCKELRTPLIEFTELFIRGIGTETDVVQKEMYTFADRKDRSMTLRPEATAGVLRACIQHKLLRAEGLVKFFTIGPMFRYERPQKGRQRQFHQINVEVLGSSSSLADADVLFMLDAFLTSIGLTDLVYEMNNLGCAHCRPAFRQALETYYARVARTDLCADCQRRMQTNPLRVLDCKVPSCREITQDAPAIADHVCAPCREHFDQVLAMLADTNLQVRLNPFLVRGLDYYQGTTFEVVSNRIGAQSSVAGGGRYDGLVRQLGGPDIPGIGFACGMERLAMLVPALDVKPPDVFVATAGSDLLPKAALLAKALRALGHVVEFSYEHKSLKSQFRTANKLGVSACIVLGQGGDQGVSIKNMATGEQHDCPEHDLPACLAKLFAEHKPSN